ncbi:hypothetical protein [Singulisphaera sp. PoT]|uniref:hypothetical protein n=1 Tax=Singulisphaera sp. PoT TaxID=3411797 RepID=UPI003BF53942
MVNWNYVFDHLESMAFWTTAFVACTGVLALGTVSLLWRHVAAWYREFMAKIVGSFFRLVAAAAAVASRAAGVDAKLPIRDQPWVTTTIIAGLGYFLRSYAVMEVCTRVERYKP